LKTAFEPYGKVKIKVEELNLISQLKKFQLAMGSQGIDYFKNAKGGLHDL